MAHTLLEHSGPSSPMVDQFPEAVQRFQWGRQIFWAPNAPRFTNPRDGIDFLLASGEPLVLLAKTGRQPPAVDHRTDQR